MAKKLTDSDRVAADYASLVYGLVANSDKGRTIWVLPDGTKVEGESVTHAQERIKASLLHWCRTWNPKQKHIP